jgi:hypothetical protein
VRSSRGRSPARSRSAGTASREPSGHAQVNRVNTVPQARRYDRGASPETCHAARGRTPPRVRGEAGDRGRGGKNGREGREGGREEGGGVREEGGVMQHKGKQRPQVSLSVWDKGAPLLLPQARQGRMEIRRRPNLG